MMAQFGERRGIKHGMKSAALARRGMLEGTINQPEDELLRLLLERPADVLAFSCYIWNWAVIRQLLLHNTGDTTLADLTVSVTSDPMFAVEWTTHVAVLAPGQTMELPVDLKLSASYLFSLTERVCGTLRVAIRQDETVLAQTTQDVTVLAHDEWSGAALIPEMVAAFVTPNHPYIARLVQRASGILGQWDGDPSFTGYQRQSPNAVRRQMAALYSAVAQEWEAIGGWLCLSIKSQKPASFRWLVSAAILSSAIARRISQPTGLMPSLEPLFAEWPISFSLFHVSAAMRTP